MTINLRIYDWRGRGLALREKLLSLYSLTSVISNSILSKYSYIHRKVCHSPLIKKILFYRWWRCLQKSTTGQNAKNKWQLGAHHQEIYKTYTWGPGHYERYGRMVVEPEEQDIFLFCSSSSPERNNLSYRKMYCERLTAQNTLRKFLKLTWFIRIPALRYYTSRKTTEVLSHTNKLQRRLQLPRRSRDLSSILKGAETTEGSRDQPNSLE